MFIGLALAQGPKLSLEDCQQVWDVYTVPSILALEKKEGERLKGDNFMKALFINQCVVDIGLPKMPWRHSRSLSLRSGLLDLWVVPKDLKKGATLELRILKRGNKTVRMWTVK